METIQSTHKKCPRCKELQDARLYEPPLTLCLVCYARIPANAGLSITDLREKARRSFSASRKKRKEEAREFANVLLGMKEVKPGREVHIVDEYPGECDVCHQQVTDYYNRPFRGQIQSICQVCKDEEEAI